MKIDIPYKFGQPVFIKNDPEQMEFLITRIILMPKGTIIFELLTPAGEYIEVWEGNISSERNMLKLMELDGTNQEPEETE